MNPVARERCLQEACRAYLRGEIDHAEYRARVRRYSPDYRAAVRVLAARRTRQQFRRWWRFWERGA